MFSAGEWGNMLIEGKPFEEIASISGLIRLVRKYKDESDWNGKRFSNCMIKVIGKLPKQLRFSFKHLAIGISNLAYIFNPEVIVIGGGITDRGNEF